MSDLPSSQATRLLQRASEGDAAARDALARLLYAELHALAEAHMRRERPDHTLQPTVLVHEAWARLIEEPSDAGPSRWEGRSHFVAVAARVMRHVLVDHARRRRTSKRGAEAARLALDDSKAADDRPPLDVLSLDEALDRLAARDPDAARVVELRFFGGLTTAETGRVLGWSVRQVEGAWVTARGWLWRELGERDAP